MRARAFVPFKRRGAKSRLHPFLSERERERLAVCMLKDVLSALSHSPSVAAVEILTRDGLSELSEMRAEISDLHMRIPLIFKEERGKGLNDALNAALKSFSDAEGCEKFSFFVLMADLPLISAEHIEELLRFNEDIVLVPGRRGGTNAIVLRGEAIRKFEFRYKRISIIEHIQEAKMLGLPTRIHDSFFFSTDIDEVGDLIDLLTFGTGFAAAYLREIGVFVTSRHGWLSLVRERKVQAHQSEMKEEQAKEIE